jgi:hypothetical protein
MTPLHLRFGYLNSQGTLVYELSKSSEINHMKEFDLYGVTVRAINSEGLPVRTNLSRCFDTLKEATDYISKLKGESCEVKETE